MHKLDTGFSLIELLIIIAIMVIVGTIAMPKLINFQRGQSLKNTTENIIGLLNRAKSNSNSSLNSENYGVHFESDYMVYFVGDTYSSQSSNNERVDFESGITLLSGNGSNIVFPRLTGDVFGYGTITLKLTALPARTKTITITKTGSVSSN